MKPRNSISGHTKTTSIEIESKEKFQVKIDFKFWDFSKGNMGLNRSSLYLTMRDDVRIAIDEMRLSDDNNSALPTLLIMTRYWRSFKLRGSHPPKKAYIGARPPIADFFLNKGYAVVVADGRGTGASEGSWNHPWSKEELGDHKEIVDWITTQEWSNGKVASAGISYEATTALLLAANGHPAIRAISAKNFEFDVYTDVALPGGVLNEAFMRAWSDSNVDLDADRVPALFGKLGALFVKGVQPVENDLKGDSLADIVQKRSNPNVFESIKNIEVTEDRYGNQDITLYDFSVVSHLDSLKAANVPLQICGSWMDGATAETALRLFESLPNVRELHIDALSHSGEHNASPFREKKKPNPTLKEQWDSLYRFINNQMSDDAEVNRESRNIHYYMMGEEKWRTTPNWPPAGYDQCSWYIDADSTLNEAACERDAEETYPVDPKASTGTGNRWYTELARPVKYGNRRHADKKNVCWTSTPLRDSLEIVGTPAVHLFLSLNKSDAQFFVYFEIISPKNRVFYVTEGIRRAIHAHVNPPTYTRADAREWEPGTCQEIKISLYPTAILIPKGWRLRLSMAGADQDTFAPLGNEDGLIFTIARGGNRNTRIDLPCKTP